MSPLEACKWLARGLATVAVVPSIVSFQIRSRLFGADRALAGSSQALALVPGILGQYLRRAFLAQALAFVHPAVAISFGTVFSRVGARIAANVYIGPYCDFGLVNIEADVMIAAGVHIPSGKYTHGSSSARVPFRDQPGRPQVVHIGKGAWIGNNAVVMADVGRGTIVGAGSVVTKPLPDGVIAAGVPARVLRQLADSRPSYEINPPDLPDRD